MKKRVVERRRFFAVAGGELLASMEDLKGRPHLRLTDVGDLPEDEFLAIELRLRPGIVLERDRTTEYGRAWIRREAGLLEFSRREELVLLDTIAGRAALSKVVARMQQELQLDRQKAVAVSREIVTRLIALELCQPVNPVGSRWRLGGA